ncbi:MAG: site-2 protease family protein [Candidatus Sulfopaludibacter sp.]|nr:site-2 protease family protein [Candidatus Sulfopaludibacter sp.]
MLTLATTTVVGTAMQMDFDRNLPFDIEHSLALYSLLWRNPAILLQGLPFSLTLLTILMAHELGHYLAATYHRVDASLPYFMPSPFMGTFGAFIRVRSAICSKRVLFDIGVAGPLAGFVFLLPAFAVGLAFSKVVPNIVHQGSIQFGVPTLQWLLQAAIFPGTRSGDLYLHPIARAAWVGTFATAMNLLPIGQLDGGHILYAFFPKWHKRISVIMCGALLALGLALLLMGTAWYGWIVWAVILFFLGRRHPMVYDNLELDAGRKKLGWIALAVFILCFAYAPIIAGGL